MICLGTSTRPTGGCQCQKAPEHGGTCSGAGSGWGERTPAEGLVHGHVQGAAGQLTPPLSSTEPPPPAGLPAAAGTPPREALHEGNVGADVIAEITADCGVCRQKIERPGSVIIGKYLSS